jgi:hypothetical protein
MTGSNQDQWHWHENRPVTTDTGHHMTPDMADRQNIRGCEPVPLLSVAGLLEASSAQPLLGMMVLADTTTRLLCCTAFN